MLTWSPVGNYPAGSNPWSGTPTHVAPGYTFFTPGLPISAQALNWVFWSISSAALDKTGDTISGLIVIGGGGTIASNQTAGITANVTDAIFSGVANGISTLTAGGISSQVPGGIALNGGSTDYPAFPSRTIVHCLPIRPLLGIISSGWSGVVSVPPWGVVGTATTNLIRLELPVQHNGATLNSVSLSVNVVVHGAVPAVGPTIRVRRTTASTSGAATTVDLSSTATQTITLTGAWSAQTQQITYTCNQNNVIDVTKYVYWIELNDETSTNAVAGNAYYAIETTYTVGDMSF